MKYKFWLNSLLSLKLLIVIQSFAMLKVAYSIPAQLTSQNPQSRINIRSSPSTQSQIRHYGFSGDKVDTLRETYSNGSLWYYIRFESSGATGWVRDDLIEGRILIPPSSGGCVLPSSQFSSNCFQNVRWELIPNSGQLQGEYPGEHAFLGINSLVRTGDSVSFDMYYGDYNRYTANCRTRVFTPIKGNYAPIQYNSWFDAQGLIGRALSLACS